VRFLRVTIDLPLGVQDAAERAIGMWVREQRLLDHWSARLAAEIGAAERRQLALLKAKYEGAGAPPPTPIQPPIPTAQRRAWKPPHTTDDVADQLSMF
jgi:hypothetical protein